MKKALYILSNRNAIYSAAAQEEIAGLVDVAAAPQRSDVLRTHPALLEDVEIVLSSWGAPKLTKEFLAAAPRLEAVFYAAGSIRSLVTDAFWDRGITISSAWGANAVPVAEFTLSQILFCMKEGWRAAAAYRASHAHTFPTAQIRGAFRSLVGIVSLGMIGRLVAERLRSFDVEVLAYDPFVAEEDAQALGVTLVSLEDLFRRCDVVTLHTPWLKETEGMVMGRHFAMMRPNATFINTARGAIVREEEMASALKERSDLFAVLDVTAQEPLDRDSLLWQLPNVVLTPHIAGSLGNECHRMGRYMVEELGRYLRGEPLKWGIAREQAQRMA